MLSNLQFYNLMHSSVGGGAGTLKNPVPTRSVRSHSYPSCTHPAGVLPEHMLTKVQGSESQVPRLKPSILKFKHLFRQLFPHSYRTNVKETDHGGLTLPPLKGRKCVGTK